MYLIYNVILLLLSPLIALLLAQRYFSGKSRAGWRERWGQLPENIQQQADARPRIWVHAVSAGEVVAAVPILRELRERLPDHTLLLSVITPAGHEMAEQQAAKFVDAIFYAPFDLPWVAHRVVHTIQPRVFVSLESEMWPNLLHELKRAGAATVLVNGRLSDKNFARSRKYAGWLLRWMLRNQDRLLMQSESDADRVRLLSGLSDAGRIQVLGNSKFDQAITQLTPEQVAQLRAELKLPPEAPVLVAGSTRSREEEAEVIAAYQTMRASFPELCLIVAPRQIDRAAELTDALHAAGLHPIRRTALATATAPVHHLVLDTLGELANIYAVATLAFVGNSFPPVVKGGGQNLLQPLAHGKPVLFGPLTATIRSEVALATGAGVGFRVQNGAELAAQGVRLLHDVRLRAEIAERALALIAANRGVSVRYAEAVVALARQAPLPPLTGALRPEGG